MGLRTPVCDGEQDTVVFSWNCQYGSGYPFVSSPLSTPEGGKLKEPCTACTHLNWTDNPEICTLRAAQNSTGKRIYRIGIRHYYALACCTADAAAPKGDPVASSSTSSSSTCIAQGHSKRASRIGDVLNTQSLPIALGCDASPLRAPNVNRRFHSHRRLLH